MLDVRVCRMGRSRRGLAEHVCHSPSLSDSTKPSAGRPSTYQHRGQHVATKEHVLGTAFLRYGRSWKARGPRQDWFRPPSRAELGAHLPWSFRSKVDVLSATVVQVLDLPQLLGLWGPSGNKAQYSVWVQTSNA